MKKWIAFIALLFSAASSATIVERDFATAGDSGLNYDPSTGLEWLDLSLSPGDIKSYESTFIAQHGFRSATHREFLDLLQAEFGFFSTETAGYDLQVAAESGVLQFYNTLGIADSAGWLEFYLDVSFVPELAAYSAGLWTFTHYHDSFSGDYVSWFPDMGQVVELRSDRKILPPLLVRQSTPQIVPEPSTLALFGIGLAAFGLKRRKS